MKKMEMDLAQKDFPAICQAVASSGQAVVVTRRLRPIVSIVPVPQSDGVEERSIWELRRQFEQSHGALTEDFAPPSRHVDEVRWEDPFWE